MKIYKVKVNGKLYEVELEAVSEVKGEIKKEETVATISNAPISSDAKTIVAPIAGKVLGVKVNVGDMIKVGQTVAVIEAMKLENEVPSTTSGKVKEIRVTKGTQVNNKDVLIVLE